MCEGAQFKSAALREKKNRPSDFHCFTLNENEPATISELTEEQLATDPRVGMRKLAFEFLLQQEYFGTASMMVAEFIGTIQRLEAAENSGKLSVPSVKAPDATGSAGQCCGFGQHSIFGSTGR
jgi:hypothetical protein